MKQIFHTIMAKMNDSIEASITRQERLASISYFFFE